MPSVLRSRLVRARKQHRCDYCLEPIGKGELYHRDTCAFDGRLYDWRTHVHCDGIANAIWRYAMPDEDGMSTAMFQESVHEVMETLYCPAACPKWDKDDGCHEFDWKACLRQFGEYMKTHCLRRVTAESGIRVWRLVEKGGSAK